MLDAYTLRKLAPRILVGVIGINLSIYLCRAAIDIVNVISAGLFNFITFPFEKSFDGFQSDGVSLAGIVSIIALSTGTVLAAASLFTFGGLFMILLSLLLWALVIFVVLAFRQGLLMMLTIFSPIAVVAWLLPNTERFFRQWWDWFLKALLVYPIIAALFAVSNALSTLYLDRAQNDDSQLFLLVALIMAGAPLFLIPWSFQISGGLIAGVGRMATNPARRFGAFAQGYNRQKMKEAWHSTKEGRRFSDNTRVGRRFNRTLQTAALTPERGFNPARWRSRTQAARSRLTSVESAKALQDENYTFKNDDDLNRAAAETESRADLVRYMETNLAGRYTDSTGRFDRNAMMQDVARIEDMRGRYGHSFRETAFQQAVAGGTSYQGEAEWLQTAGQIAGNDNARLSNMVGAGRSAAMGAGRVDQGGGAFGTTFRLAQELRDGNVSLPDANRQLAQDVLKSQGPGTLAHQSMKPQSIRNLAPQLAEQLRATIATGNQDAIDSKLADISNLHDALQSTSPQLADEFTGLLMDQRIEVGSLSPAQQSEFESAYTTVTNPGQEVHVRDPVTGNMVVTRQGVQRDTHDEFNIRQAVDARRSATAFKNKKREWTEEQRRTLGGGGAPGPGAPPVPPAGGGVPGG